MSKENDKSNPFSKREWVFTIFIISIIQGFVWYAAFENSSSESALNYVSFSGTLISIILAVLAIGYTYGESVSEKNKGDNLSAQINVLEEVVKSIKFETDQISNISTISDNLVTLRKDLENKINSTSNQVMNLHASVDGIRETFLNNGPDGSMENDANFLMDDVLNLVGIKNYPVHRLAISLIYNAILFNKIRSASDLAEPSIEVMSSLDIEDKSEKTKQLYLILGSSASLFILLEESNMISKNDEGFFEMDNMIKDKIREELIPNFNSDSDAFNKIMEQIKLRIE